MVTLGPGIGTSNFITRFRDGQPIEPEYVPRRPSSLLEALSMAKREAMKHGVKAFVIQASDRSELRVEIEQ